MNRIVKSLLCLTLALMLLLTAGCAKKSDVKSFPFLLEGVADRGGVVLEGIQPGMSKEEVIAAGIKLGTEPFRTSDDESGRSSETYPASNTITLGKGKFIAPEFQFMNGKLVDVTLNTKDEALTSTLLNQLKAELGEPQVQQDPEIQYWEIDQGDYMLRIVYLPKNVSGAMYITLQVSYVYYEWFPQYKK